MVSSLQNFTNMHCLESKRCCYSVSLKVGTIIIGFLGLLPGIAHIVVLSIGNSAYEADGATPLISTIMVHIYAISGVLMVAVHIILIIAAFKYNEKLILLYLWFWFIYFFIDLVLKLMMIIAAVTKGFYANALLHLIIFVIMWMCLYIFIFPVVNGFRRSIHTVVIILG